MRPCHLTKSLQSFSSCRVLDSVYMDSAFSVRCSSDLTDAHRDVTARVGDLQNTAEAQGDFRLKLEQRRHPGFSRYGCLAKGVASCPFAIDSYRPIAASDEHSILTMGGFNQKGDWHANVAPKSPIFNTCRHPAGLTVAF